MPIHTATFSTSHTGLHDCYEPVGDEFAFIGRSNVGKSTLINTICNKKHLANVSGKPGKTQLINYFHIVSGSSDSDKKKERQLVDLPGYGYARVSKKARTKRQDMITLFLRKRPLTMVFVLIDSSIGVQDIDIEFLIRLENKRIIYTIVFTKADKNNQKQASAYLKNFTTACTKEQIELPMHFTVNQKKPKSVQMLVEYIEGLVE